MKYLLIFIVCLITTSSKASIPNYVSLNQLIQFTDHLFTVRVIDIDMIDKHGDKIVKLEARTGPNLGNKIRLILKVEKTHYTTSKKIPDTIAVPLDSQMHYSLGQIKEAHKNKTTRFLALLEGSTFKPAYKGVFKQSLKSLKQILKVKSDLSKSGYKRPEIKPKAGSPVVLRAQKKFKLLGLYDGKVDGVSNDLFNDVLFNLADLMS